MKEMLNVRQFGAVGNGFTDDSPIINSVLEKGGEIFIPDGDYLLGDTLTVPSHTHIIASDGARLFRKAHTQTGRKDFLLTNSDPANGNTDISISGGIWDGNCYEEDRGTDLFDPSATTGVLLNFRNVKELSLYGMTLKNALCYYTRFCEAENVRIENIRFSSDRIIANQDGIHLAGFCKNFVIHDLFGAYGSPNDDFIALNADDAMARQECFDTVCGPIENISVYNLSSDFCHCFVRLLSVFNPIKNVEIRNVSGRCKGRAINLDAARNCRVPLFDDKDYPDGVGSIENFSIDGLTVGHDSADEPFFMLETNGKNLTVRNFRNTGDTDGAFVRIGHTAAYHYAIRRGDSVREADCPAGQQIDLSEKSADSFSFGTL